MKTPGEPGASAERRATLDLEQVSARNLPPMRCATAILGVIMPVYNEVEHLEAIIERVLAQACVRELVVVDDGSSDGPRALLDRWSAEDPRVRLVRHPVNRGKGAAIRSGLGVITSPVVVIQDADLEYDPADYSSMLSVLIGGENPPEPFPHCAPEQAGRDARPRASTPSRREEEERRRLAGLPTSEAPVHGEADVVYGSRFLRGGNVTWKWHRAANWVLTWIGNACTGLNLTDAHTCLKMAPSALLRMLALEEERFGFCAEVTAKLAHVPRLRIVEVPIGYHPRRRGQGKKIGFRDGVRAVYCYARYGLMGRDSGEWKGWSMSAGAPREVPGAGASVNGVGSTVVGGGKRS